MGQVDHTRSALTPTQPKGATERVLWAYRRHTQTQVYVDSCVDLLDNIDRQRFILITWVVTKHHAWEAGAITISDVQTATLIDCQCVCLPGRDWMAVYTRGRGDGGGDGIGGGGVHTENGYSNYTKLN